MKRFLLLLLLLVGASAGAQTIITVTVTVTNAATNGFTFSLNGVLRNWTNNVTASTTQIQTPTTTSGTNTVYTNSITITASNLWTSYAVSPAPSIMLTHPSSNKVAFQSYPGTGATVLIGSNWATVSYSTNTVTNATVVRVPFSIAGNYERTNVESGLVAYLSDSAMTNAVDAAAPAWTNFFSAAQLVGITNFVKTNAINLTNFALTIGANGSNYTRQQVLNYSNYVAPIIAGLDTAAYKPIAYFQPACGVLSNFCADPYGFLGGLSYLDASGNIVLKNSNAVERVRANINADFYQYWEDGNQMFHATYPNHTLYWYDHAGTIRLELDDPADNTGASFLRSSSGRDGLRISGVSDSAVFDRPVTFQNAVWPATAIGTTTNFIADSKNRSASLQSTNNFNVPAYTMTNNGDYLIRTFGLSMAAPNVTHLVEVYFSGLKIFTTGNFTNSSTAGLSITCEVVRRDATTVAYNCSAIGQGTYVGGVSVVTWSQSGTSGFTASANTSFYISLQGSADNEITVVTDNTRLAPSPAWAKF